MSNTYDAIVVGGGVIGGAIAYNLAKRGKGPFVRKGSTC